MRHKNCLEKEQIGKKEELICKKGVWGTLRKREGGREKAQAG